MVEEDDRLFQRKGKTLLFSGVDVATRAHKDIQTPAYVFSEERLIRNITTLRSAFTKHYPKTALAYSMKNNLLPEILSIISKEILLYEANSIQELTILEQCAQEKNLLVNPIATNIYKSDAFMTAMITSRLFDEPLFAVDSFQDFTNLERVAKQKKKVLSALVRVNPGFKTSATDAVFSSAGISSKCGAIIANPAPLLASLGEDYQKADFIAKRETIPKRETAEQLIQEVSKSKHLLLRGLHFHPGSQIINLTYFDRFYALATAFFRQTLEQVDSHHFDILDLGGGYPVQYFTQQSVPSPNSIAELLAAHINKQAIAPEVILESGRFITASAAILLSKVLLTKTLPTGQKIAVMDFSVYSDLLDVLTAGWHYEPLLMNNLPENASPNEQHSKWLLVGSTNDVLDSLSPLPPVKKQSLNKKKKQTRTEPTSFSFPRELRVGDIIAITNVGAYTTCFNSKYAGKPLPLSYILYQKKQPIFTSEKKGNCIKE